MQSQESNSSPSPPSSSSLMMNLIASDGNSMIIDISPSHAEYIESSSTNCKHPHEYFCLFCAVKFNCKLEAYPHYGEHLKYKPVLCLLCDHRFHDTESLTIHHKLNHPQASDLMYEIHEDQNIERWVDEFLEFQNTQASRRLLLKCSCGLCCPICDRILGAKRSSPTTSMLLSTPCFSHAANDLNFLDHLHQHIAYHAYECSLCKKMGVTTRLTSLDGVAVNHLREAHSFKDISPGRLLKLYPKSLSIDELDRFIAESMQRKRILEKKWRSTKMEQMKSKKIMMKQFLQYSNSVPSYLQYPSNNGLPHRQNPISANDNCFMPGKSQNSVKVRENVNHVRVEGGRVINLPSSLSIRAIQARNNLLMGRKNPNMKTSKSASNDIHSNSLIDLTQQSSQQKQALNPYNREGMTAVRSYVKCLHCNSILPTRKSLKVHHRQNHPGLTIALLPVPEPNNSQFVGICPHV
ncbi:uncharacterized protein LOC141858550 [Brevipalpus obovatus]|uniref:uncharacterized protein LOC141858550 n=1 Tax=Brevipalpus obovatus TaxID=246614 RepID=UPI003D9E6A35